MRCLHSLAVCIFVVAALSTESADPHGQEMHSSRQTVSSKCIPRPVSLLQRRQSRNRWQASDSPVGLINVAHEVSGRAVPFGAPFYLKGVTQPQKYVCSEHGDAIISSHLTFSENPDNALHSMQFVAEDAGTGLFHLRSGEHPKTYVGVEGVSGSAAAAPLVWQNRSNRIRFAIERTGGHQFFLKSGDYADAYVRLGGKGVQNGSLLVLGTYAFNVSKSPFKFVVELAQDQDENKTEDELGAYCNVPLVGGKNAQAIPNKAITVSSENPRDGNLNERTMDSEGAPHGWGGKDSRIDDKNSAWLAASTDANQWIQWDFGQVRQITRIQTLGRPHRGLDGDDQWVAAYKLSYRKDENGSWTFYDRAFRGNNDRETLVEHTLDPPIVAEKLRLHPTKWHSKIALRAELIGCPLSTTPAPVISACSSCARCEVVPGTGAEKGAATKCPLCAYDMLTAWPCNVSGICRCAKEEEAMHEVEWQPCGEACEHATATRKQEDDKHVPAHHKKVRSKKKVSRDRRRDTRRTRGTEEKYEPVPVQPPVWEEAIPMPAPLAMPTDNSSESLNDNESIPVVVIPRHSRAAHHSIDTNVPAGAAASEPVVVVSRTRHASPTAPETVTVVPGRTCPEPCPTSSSDEWVPAKPGHIIK